MGKDILPHRALRRKLKSWPAEVTIRNQSGSGSVQRLGWADGWLFGARKCSAGGTRPKEVDAMRARRFSKMARSLEASALVLLVLALVSCFCFLMIRRPP